MAESASTTVAQQKRDFDADTFARQNTRQVDPNAYAQSQSERLQTQLDAAQTGAKPVEKEAVERYVRQNNNFSARFNQLRTLRNRAMGPNPQAVAAEAINRSYTQYFNVFQSELIANAMALEVVVSPWVFLILYGVRIIAGVLPIRVKGIAVIPPYSLRSVGGFGVFVGHTTAALVILTILFLILFFIMFIVWTISEGPITQTQLYIDLSGGVLKAIANLFTAVTNL